jgi:predicted small secreted protein
MTDSLYKTLLALLFALSVPLLTTGCNTIEGLGEDASAAGEEIDEEAEEEEAD